MEQKFLKKDQLEQFAVLIARTHDIYYIGKGTKGKLHLAKYSDRLVNPVIGEVRPFEPLKSLTKSSRLAGPHELDGNGSQIVQTGEPVTSLMSESAANPDVFAPKLRIRILGVLVHRFSGSCPGHPTHLH